MRTDTPTPGELAGARFWTTVRVTLGRQAVVLPVMAGHVVWQADQSPSVQVTGLRLPILTEAGEDVIMTGLVGSEGHRVHVECHARSGAAVWDWSMGTYQISQVRRQDGGTIEVTGQLLTAAIADHKYAAAKPVNVRQSALTVLQALAVEDGVRLDWSGDLVARRIPSDYTIGTDRGEAWAALLEVIGAYATFSPHADVRIRPVPEPTGTPVMTITGGVGGTVVDTEITLDRAQIFNHIIVPVKDSDQVAEFAQRDGRYAVNRFGWRSKEISGADVPNLAQASLVARAELTKSLARAVIVPVELIPDWRIEPYDLVRVTVNDVSRMGLVTGVDWPLTHADTMVIDIATEV
ncbi:hypothetical protein [Actinobaculum sp. 352]|uniref:hypothetical protein n=1 Tax=Actinobaculum sp. 352 TaxID=2490946 RepID=UPI000F7EB0A2|nr:hypothetical protein [Actinobaculum sp. 352]RTE48832.1 hypothetical protein EKN07_09005 [Actinobaculum sp. 352]